MFELERRTKFQNVGNGMAYIAVGLNFRYNFPRPNPKMVAILNISKYLW